jgi:cell division protein FtsB
MTQELDRTQEEIASLEQANTALREDIDLLESDLFTLEQVARERLGYVKEGETVYQFVESP